MVDIDEINEELKNWHIYKLEQLDLLHQHADKNIKISPNVTFKLRTDEEISAFRMGVLLSKSLFHHAPEI